MSDRGYLIPGASTTSHAERHIELVVRPEPWMEKALCAQTDPEVFFPDKGDNRTDGRDVCARCDVREECAIYALVNREQHGIWGGLTLKDRRRIWAKEARP
jgi:WhiB family redox-sensing transcriptional regulator